MHNTSFLIIINVLFELLTNKNNKIYNQEIIPMMSPSVFSKLIFSCVEMQIMREYKTVMVNRCEHFMTVVCCCKIRSTNCIES